MNRECPTQKPELIPNCQTGKKAQLQFSSHCKYRNSPTRPFYIFQSFVSIFIFVCTTQQNSPNDDLTEATSQYIHYFHLLTLILNAPKSPSFGDHHLSMLTLQLFLGGPDSFSACISIFGYVIAHSPRFGFMMLFLVADMLFLRLLFWVFLVLLCYDVKMES